MTAPVIVVTGASSQIGFFLIPQLLAGGYTVIAISRQPLPNYFQKFTNTAKLQWVATEQLETSLGDSSFTLISVGPLSLTVQLLAKFTPEQVLAISTASIYFKQTSSDPQERKLIASIQESENLITAWGAKQRLGVVILRPTLVYGCGLDQNLSRVAKLIERWGFLPITGNARGLRQPVHAEDIATLCANLLAQDNLSSGTWALAGGSNLSYRQMLVAIFAALGRKPRFLPLPKWLLAAASRLLSGVHPAMISRQSQDLSLSDQSAQEQLGWQPRKFQLSKSELTRPTA